MILERRFRHLTPKAHMNNEPFYNSRQLGENHNGGFDSFFDRHQQKTVSATLPTV